MGDENWSMTGCYERKRMLREGLFTYGNKCHRWVVRECVIGECIIYL